MSSNIFEIPNCNNCNNSGYNYPLFTYKGNFVCFKCLKYEENKLWQQFIIEYEIIFNIKLSSKKVKLKLNYLKLAYGKTLKYYEELFKEFNQNELEIYNNKRFELQKINEKKLKNYNTLFKFSFIIFISVFIFNYNIFSNLKSFFILSCLYLILYFIFNPEKKYNSLLNELPKPNFKGKDSDFILNSEYYKSIVNDYDFKFSHYQNRFLNDIYTRQKILIRDNYTCQNCQKVFSTNNLEVHHIIPRAKGGEDKMINVVTLCIKCHNNETWYGHRRAFKK